MEKLQWFYNSCIDKKDMVEISEFIHLTKANSKNATGVDTSDWYIIYQLDIDKLKHVPSNLSYLKTKVDKLDVDTTRSCCFR